MTGAITVSLFNSLERSQQRNNFVHVEKPSMFRGNTRQFTSLPLQRCQRPHLKWRLNRTGSVLSVVSWVKICD